MKSGIIRIKISDPTTMNRSYGTGGFVRCIFIGATEVIRENMVRRQSGEVGNYFDGLGLNLTKPEKPHCFLPFHLGGS